MALKTDNILVVEVDTISDGCSLMLKSIPGEADMVLMSHSDIGRYSLSDLKKAIEALEKFIKPEDSKLEGIHLP